MASKLILHRLCAGLGKTTGWIHRTALKKGGVHMVGGVSYSHVDDEGIHLKDKSGNTQTLDVSSYAVCTVGRGMGTVRR